MANEITVGLRFTADTAAAKQNIQSLQQSLASLSKINTTNGGLGFDKEFLSAKQSAIELKNILNQTFNASTGRLDLRAFSSSLQASGKTLTDYRKQLGLLGDDGDKAFRQVATAVMDAEVPLMKTNKLAASLWDSLKRTAKWQLSSSIIHGFMGAVQKAYGYAQDLNESLNNIRIVTGQSVDQMAKFAKQANESAKALSTTTTAYTDAALIYYQQGLNDQQVKERTDITVKMANVTRESAETVSQQLTAVWNNFAKGSESLELFADKMTALGAATASSTDEISQGLEKFAGVADTIGLSFDYAAAALTTITSTTRQSADSVGTALKTLFSRLESLKLGETLEDGTSFTKYSEALAVVGVNIKGANGELKDMDQILDETMAKWKTLTKDQQVALAQTVAGQRQYTQFVTLMDNADFFKQNLATEAEAAGTLQEQADIYAESWEAAQKRVQAALEEIYDKLISSDGFINLLNGAEKFINLISKIIDSLGGLQGVLSLVGVIITKIFSNEIAMSIDNLINRIHEFNGQTASEMMTLKTQASEILAEMSFGTGESAVFLERNVELQRIALQLGNKLSAQDLARIQNQIEFNNSMKEATDIISMELDKKRDIINAIQEEIASEEALKNIRASQMTQQSSGANVMNLIDQTQGMQGSDLEKIRTFSVNVNHDELADISTKAATAGQEIDSLTKKLNTLYAELKNNSAGAEITQQTIDKVLVQIQERIGLIRTEAEKASQTPVINLDGIDNNAKKLIEYYKQISAVQNRISTLPKISPVDTTGLENSKVKLKEIITMIQKAKSSSGGNANGIKDLLKINVDDIKSLKDLENAINKVKEAANKQQESLTKNLLDNGFTQQQIDELRELGIVTDEVTEAERRKAELDKLLAQLQQALIDSLGKQAVSIGKVINGISNYAMTLSMAASTMGNWVKNLFDGKLTLEDFTSGIMALTTGLHILNTISTLSGKLMDAYRHATELSALMTDKETAAKNRQVIIEGLQQSNLTKLILKKQAQAMGIELTTGAINKETGSLGLNTGGVLANALAWMIHPLFGPILAILSAVVLGIVAVSSAVKENTERIHENAEAAAQKAEETREEVKALNEQKQAYDDVYDKFKQGIATKDEYTEATSSLAEALGIENAAILIEQGRYEELNRLIDEYLTKKKIEAADAARESVKNRQKDAKTQAKEIGLNVGNSLSYISTVDTGYGNIGGDAGITFDKLNSDNFKFVSAPTTTTSGMMSYRVGLKAIHLEDQNEVNTAIDEINQLIDYAKANGASEEFLDAWRAEAKHLEEWKKKYFDANLDDFRTIVEGLEASGDIKTDFSDLNFDNYDGKIKEVAQTILDENLPGMTEEIANQLAQELVSGKDADLAKKIDLVDRLFKISPEQTQPIKDKIHDFVESLEDDTTINYLLSLPEEELTKIANDLDNFQEKYGEQVIIFKTETNFNAAIKGQKELNQLEIGKSYKFSEIENIVQVLNEAEIGAEQFFTEMADGTYLVGTSLATLKYQFEELKLTNYLKLMQPLSESNKELEAQAEKIQNQIDILNKGNVSSQSFVNTLQEIAKETGRTIDELKNDFENGHLIEDLNTKLGETQNEISKIINKTQELSNSLRDSISNFDQLERYKETNILSDDDYSMAYTRLRDEYLGSRVDSQELINYTDALLKMDSALDESEQKFKGNAIAAEEYARSVLRMNQGVETLAKNMENWASILLNTEDMLSSKYIKAVQGATDAVADLLDVISYDIPSDFVQQAENIELMKKAAEGSEEAIDELRSKLNDAIIADIIIKNDLQDKKDEILNAHQNLKMMLENDDIVIGTKLDTTEFLSAAQALVDQAGMSAAQAQAYFDSLGYTAELDTTTVDLPSSHTETTITPKITFEDIDWGDSGSGSTFGNTVKKIIGGLIKVPHISFVGTSTQVPDEPGSATGYSIGPKGKVEKPVIKSLTKKATGINNDYSSRNAGGNPSSGSGGGGGGGGGDRTEKKLDDEIDRYHEINNVLEDIARELDKVNTLKDRAYGAKHLAAIDSEIALLNQQSEALSQKRQEMEAYMEQDRAAAAAAGASFDAQGRITNYNSVIASAVEQYNSGALDDDQYSEIKDAMSKYEETRKELLDLEEEYAETLRQILDAKFEKVEYTVEIKLDTTDFDNKFLEWQMDRLEDRAFKSAERMANYLLQGENFEKNFNTYKEGITGILEAAGATANEIEDYFNGNVDAIAALEDLTDQAVQDLREYTEGLMDASQSLREMKEAIEDELVSAWEEHNEKVEEAISLYDHLEKKIEFFKDITDVLGIKRLGLTAQMISRINASSINLMQNRVDSLKEQIAMNEEALEKAQAGLANATTEADKEYWEEYIKQIKEKNAEVYDDLLDNTSELIEAIQDDFTEMIDNLFAEFEDQLAGAYTSFEDMSTAFDQKKTLKEDFLPTYQKIYELNKMNRNLEKEMSKLNNSKNQERLRDLQKEINKLREDGVKMSQYDLDYLQKRYDLRLAEIALEDAQNNKNTMRLTRDSAGNYNYVYTTDENVVEQAAQSFEDAMYNAQKTTEDYIDSTSGSFMSTLQDYYKALQEIANDPTLSIEEKMKKQQQAADFYLTQLQYWNREASKGLSNNNLLFGDSELIKKRFNGIIGYSADFTDSFNKTVLGSLTGSRSMEEFLQAFVNGTGQLFDTAIDRTVSMNNAIENALNELNVSLESFSQSAVDNLATVDAEVEEVNTSVDELVNKGKEDFETLTNAVMEAQDKISPLLEQMTQEVNTLSNAFSALTDTLINMEVAAEDIADLTEQLSDFNAALGDGYYGDDYSSGGDSNTDRTGFNGTPPKTGGGDDEEEKKDPPKITPPKRDPLSRTVDEEIQDILKTGDAKTLRDYLRYQEMLEYKDKQDAEVKVKQPQIKAAALANLYAIEKQKNKGGGNRINTNVRMSMATGGYTGVWGPEGRLAMLHEKELVLNKEDTKNMLAAVDLVRQLANLIDLSKISVRQLANNSSWQNTLSSYSNASNNTNQEIHIEANFPGVTAREEIEQAFAELATQASQYIHRY